LDLDVTINGVMETSVEYQDRQHEQEPYRNQIFNKIKNEKTCTIVLLTSEKEKSKFSKRLVSKVVIPEDKSELTILWIMW
jgi:hypothetical protein